MVQVNLKFKSLCFKVSGFILLKLRLDIKVAVTFEF